LENCYPNVFTVRCARDSQNSELVSYSYVDILTQAVEVAVEADESLAVLADRDLEEADGAENAPAETETGAVADAAVPAAADPAEGDDGTDGPAPV
jgi:hypothetical protein